MADDPVIVETEDGETSGYERVKIHPSGWVECYNVEYDKSLSKNVKSEVEHNYPPSEVKSIKGPTNNIKYESNEIIRRVERMQRGVASMDSRLGAIDKTLDMNLRD
jgi:hypothetical protein